MNNLSAELKISTSYLHRNLENKMVPRIKALQTTSDYKKLLQLFYGFFGSLEMNINNSIAENILPDFAERRKATALADDLADLPGENTLQPSAAEGSFIQNNLQALGALYVMEGSTLGGQVITKMIQTRLQTANIPLRFFNGYGENTMPMWLAFKTALDGLDLDENSRAEVIDAANITFKRFAGYIDVNG